MNPGRGAEIDATGSRAALPVGGSRSGIPVAEVAQTGRAASSSPARTAPAAAFEFQQPDRLAIAQLPCRQEAGTSVETLGTLVVGVHCQSDFVTIWPSFRYVSEDEFDGRCSHSPSLRPQIDGQVKQLCPRGRMGKREDADDGTLDH